VETPSPLGPRHLGQPTSVDDLLQLVNSTSKIVVRKNRLIEVFDMYRMTLSFFTYIVDYYRNQVVANQDSK
jgi:hypothetical protein